MKTLYGPLKWARGIPGHWEIRRLKLCVHFVEGPGILASDFVDEGIPLLRLEGIGSRRVTLSGCNFLSPDLVSKKWAHFRVQTGDLLISGSASTGLCSEVDRTTAGAIPYTGLIIVRPKEGRVDRNFVRWFFLSDQFSTQAALARTGSTIQHFGPTHLSQMFIAVPPLVQQRVIAEFLDRETVRLDALIVAKERVLRFLAEKRQALITRAATRSLDPGVPLRDSGIPWIGKIPAHWVATRLKFVAEVRGGLALGKNYGSATLTEYPYLRVANVQDGHLDLSEVSTVLVPESEAKSCLLKAGDVLMNEGGDADKLGRGCIWKGELSPCLHQNHVFAVRPRLVRSEWLNAWTSTDVAKAFFESRAKQSTNLASISASNIKELPIPVPDVDEQSAIVAHIGRELAKLDDLRAVTERTIALLKERRAALIAAAVMGELPIPEAPGSARGGKNSC